ncbi:MAG: glycosyltransferase [Alphaproteobacteria bacterium]|nr:glycosyltransferase [Alphaproteobacteria bacterium]
MAKFGISYSVYDGEELLEASIRHIRSFVDYICIVYSEKSWYGDAANPGLAKLVHNLKQSGLVDEVIHYETNPVDKNSPQRLKFKTAEQIKKRNVGLAAARKAGCDYFMTMDTDEFYDKAAFQKAQEFIRCNPKISHFFVHILNYGRSPTERYDGRKWEYFVPFFAKIRRNSMLGTNKKVPCVTDPTRNVSHHFGARYWVLSDIFMHHFTRVRKDLDNKYSARVVPKTFDDDWINNEERFIKVPDYFGLKDLW